MNRLLGFLCAIFLAATTANAEPQFDEYEIRVIRPRYFTKSGHLEVAAGIGAIMNQTFIYSFLATGLLTWHFSETLAIEGQGGLAANADRQDKKNLDEKFGIKTILLRPESLANGRVVWTPSYGKFNLTSSHIMYFDTHVTLGAGLTGVRYLYDHCEDPNPPSEKSRQYQTFVVGLGQRFFLDRKSSLRVGFELQRLLADKADGACFDGAPSETFANDNLFLNIGWSYYL